MLCEFVRAKLVGDDPSQEHACMYKCLLHRYALRKVTVIVIYRFVIDDWIWHGPSIKARLFDTLRLSFKSDILGASRFSSGSSTIMVKADLLTWRLDQWLGRSASAQTTGTGAQLPDGVM